MLCRFLKKELKRYSFLSFFFFFWLLEKNFLLNSVVFTFILRTKGKRRGPQSWCRKIDQVRSSLITQTKWPFRKLDACCQEDEGHSKWHLTLALRSLFCQQHRGDMGCIENSLWQESIARHFKLGHMSTLWKGGRQSGLEEFIQESRLDG